ncbi:phage tail sheath C-terminal domain-containing protein [Pararoseomonas sp. SCSIO 73927]|uniref:phage tail sheath C-terminal domain-containing protein n=1 Tax=Pararoseomonas sp. SCSIO 73927 TaxID=3114537 RepID=UPI0030D48F9C
MSGSISFDGIPVAIRLPGTYVEISNRRAQQGLLAWPARVLLVGQKVAGGTAPIGVPFPIAAGYADARLAGGRGSLLEQIAKPYFANAGYTETWGLVLDEPSGGAPATATIAVTGTATASGTIALLINQLRVPVGVTVGQTAGQVASAIQAALAAAGDLPVTAAVTTSTVTCTARNKGEHGNGIDMRHSFYRGESLPAGISLAISAFTGGTGNPSIQTALDAMGDAWFTDYVLPYTDGSNVAALEAKLLGDFGPLVMRDSTYWTAIAGTYSSCYSYLSSRNGQVGVTFPLRGAPFAPYQFAAAAAGFSVPLLAADPARPIQNVAMAGILATPPNVHWTRTERELFLNNGGSTFRVGNGGEVIIERAVTNYRLAAAGVPDTSYLNLETLKTVAFLRYDLRTFIPRTYPRHKLANDGTQFAQGQAVVTPGLARAEIIARARQWETAGLVENLDQFKEDIIVKRNPDDPDRLDAMLPPDLVNQLRVFAAQIQFLN